VVSPPFQVHENLKLATLLSGLERSDKIVRQLSPPLRALTNLKLAILMSGLERSDKKQTATPAVFPESPSSAGNIRSKVHQPKLIAPRR
jgi:hypothetical protein